MLRFSPLSCIKKCKEATEKIALVILNRDAQSEVPDLVFLELWKKSVFRACADGGANFLYDTQHKAKNGFLHSAGKLLPDLVSGDFDSIRSEVKEFYEKQERTSVVHTPDQDETDFTKSLRLISERVKENKLDVDLIVALGGRQDRFDHSMGNISTLFKARSMFPKHVRTCMLFGCSYVCLLPEGKTVMDVGTGLEGEWCGLLPVGRPAIVTTTGLKWNLSEGLLEFGKMISTSNELDGSGQVSVVTDSPIVWTMKFKQYGQGGSSRS